MHLQFMSLHVQLHLVNEYSEIPGQLFCVNTSDIEVSKYIEQCLEKN